MTDRINSNAGPIAVLAMAYGGPDRIEDVEPYLLDVRGGRATPKHIVEEVKQRYRQIGGRSPIREKTQAQVQGLARALDTLPGDFRVFMGMRHWHPFIHETLEKILEEGLDRVVGLVLAPHFSKMSVQAYYDRLYAAISDHDAQVQVAEIRSWNMDPGYLDVLEERIRSALQEFDSAVRAGVHLVFTAHSLPERILEWNDPYPEELDETYRELSRRFPRHASHFAYQSEAMTPDPWLGPDAGDLMESLLKGGEANAFLVIPIGFVSEHVEILYDIDIEFKQMVEGKGGTLKRIVMPGSAGPMMESLARRIVDRAGEQGWL